MRCRNQQTSLYIIFVMICMCSVLSAQNPGNILPTEADFKESTTRYWVNTYGNIRVSKRLFWVAQTHFRFQETESTPYMGQIAQVYNRHAIGYIYSKYFNACVGGVLRLNYNTDPDSEARSMVPEWRIWHQYQFAAPIWSATIYHRIRLEHRWSQGFADNSDWIYRNRWRYMFRVKQPLNKPQLQSKTLYIAPEVELIMQSGKVVVASPMEDLRLTTTIGYIISPQLTIATGIMYSTGQSLENGGIYSRSWTMRTHLYFAPDFRRAKNKIPGIHYRD